LGIAYVFNMATFTGLTLGGFCNIEVSPVEEFLWDILIHRSGKDNDKKKRQVWI